MNDPLAAALALLREGLDISGVDPASQERYERWAKLDTWRARGEALPLLIGVDPETASRASPGSARSAAEDCLWAALSEAIGSADPETPVTPFALRRFAQDHGLELPLGLARLLDFIALVLPARAEATGGGAAAEHAVALAADRETTLGAALWLLTRQPQDCLDAEGCYDAARIVELIRARAVFWWPLDPPALSREQMIDLVGKWLPETTL